MRKGWTQNQDMVTRKRAFVDPYIDLVRQGWMPVLSCDLPDLIPFDDPQGRQSRGRIPGMVQQANMLEPASALLRRDANQFMKALLAQRWMCPQRHHEIKLSCVMQNIAEQAEQKGQRQGACMIRDEDQHALIRELSLKSFVQRFGNLIVIEELIRRSYGLGINHIVYIVQPSAGKPESKMRVIWCTARPCQRIWSR